MKKLLALAFMWASLVSCGNDKTDPASNDTNADAPGIMAVGWDHVKMRAAGSDTKVRSHGHFEADWTPCYRGSSGVIKDPAAWRTIVNATNKAITLTPQEDERCWEAPSTNKIHGDVEAMLKPDKKFFPMIDGYYGKLCTKLPDLQLAKDLAHALNIVALQAEREDCTRDPR